MFQSVHRTAALGAATVATLATLAHAQLPNTPAVTREFTLFTGDLRANAATREVTYFGGVLQGDATTREATYFGGNLRSNVWTREAAVTVGECTIPTNAPVITMQPTPVYTCVTGNATFGVAATGTGRTVYLWQIEELPIGTNTWFDLRDGAFPFPFVTVATISGATTPSLTIRFADPGVRSRYRVIVSNACGDVTSADATLNFCPADFDDGSGTGTCDGGVTIDDLLYYLLIFEQGSIQADVDDGSGTGSPDGGVTIDDLLYFLQRFEAGC